MNRITGKLFLLILLASALIPFASTRPDGLERVAMRLRFHSVSVAALRGLMPDYSLPGVPHSRGSSVITGLIGMLLVFALSAAMGAWLKRRGSHIDLRQVPEHERSSAH